MRLLALGENVCDLYLSRGMMYPGGQCANTAVYAAMRGVFSAYMGVFGSDSYAEVCRGGLEAFGVDLSHCRSVEGENGYCRIEHRGTDRVFAGSNRFGVNRTQPLELTTADWDYFRTFDVIYTDCNGQVDRYLPELAKTGIPVAYDFSAKIADEKYEGMGFCIPSAQAKTIVDSLIKNSYVEGRVKIGISGNAVAASDVMQYNVPQGILVKTIDKDGPCYDTGLKTNDIITALDGEMITSFADIYEILEKHKPGDKVILKYYSSSDQEQHEVEITLQEDKR